MARIRSIHPGLLTDEAFMGLTIERPIAVALLLGLWMEADDAGTFEWKPLTIKARCLPVATDDIGDILDVLVKFNFIKKFELYGKPFGVVRNFVRFQRPKAPHDIHPSSEETRAYAGFTSEGNRPNAGTGRKPSETTSEQVPNEFETPSEMQPQMKEEGGRKKEEKEKKRACALAFDEFWQAWPNKVGKPAAEKAFAKHAGNLPAVLAGVQRYIREKPPDRAWLNPATFLNQERFNDAPASVVPIRGNLPETAFTRGLDQVSGKPWLKTS